MKNREIEVRLHMANMPKYALADALGISEPTLYRWLRHELPEEKRQRIMDAITAYARARGGAQDE